MNTCTEFCIVTVLGLIHFSGASESWIVDGKIAKPHSRKYMASLQSNGGHFCGGFLIRNDFVLTAAHCIREMPMTVVLGAHNLTEKEPSQQKIKVKECIQHPSYDGAYDFDIMLLKLNQKAKINKFVETIDLPTKEKNVKAHTKCSVAGWGKTQPQDSYGSDVLRVADEQIQFNFECKHIWENYYNTKHMICTKFSKKGGSICQGDSGGPLICKNKPVGITAFTKRDDCNNLKFPHAFTKISSFLPWIKKVVGGQINSSKPLKSQEINERFN